MSCPRRSCRRLPRSPLLLWPALFPSTELSQPTVSRRNYQKRFLFFSFLFPFAPSSPVSEAAHTTLLGRSPPLSPARFFFGARRRAQVFPVSPAHTGRACCARFAALVPPSRSYVFCLWRRCRIDRADFSPRRQVFCSGQGAIYAFSECRGWHMCGRRRLVLPASSGTPSQFTRLASLRVVQQGKRPGLHARSINSASSEATAVSDTGV